MKAKIAYGWVVTLEQLYLGFTEAKIEELINDNLLHPVDPEDPNTMYVVGIIYQTCGRGDTALATPSISAEKINLLCNLTHAFVRSPDKILFLDPTDN